MSGAAIISVPQVATLRFPPAGFALRRMHSLQSACAEHQEASSCIGSRREDDLAPSAVGQIRAPRTAKVPQQASEAAKQRAKPLAG